MRIRLRRCLLRLAVLSVVLGLFAWLVFEAVVTQVGWRVEQQLGDPSNYRPPAAAVLYDKDGNVFDSFAAERRLWVDIDTLPPHVWQAFLAAEDRKFFEHGGVDPYAIARAALANFKAGHVTEGGSTITQQLAKNLVVGDERSYTRKLHEALVAAWLERHLSKMDILELYVNFVYLGGGTFGVEAAAQHFFDRPAKDLDPGQAATLAGVIPAPSRYNPEENPEFARGQRDRVLDGMVAMGVLTAEEADGYRDDPVRVAPAQEQQVSHVGDAYRTQVRRELRRLFGEDRVFREGLQVRTAYDPTVQASAELAIREAVRALQERQGLRGPLAQLEPDAWDAWLASAPELPRDGDDHVLAPAAGACFPALVRKGISDLGAGPFRFALRPEDLKLRVRALDPLEGGLGSLAGRARGGAVLHVCATGTARKVGADLVPEVTYDVSPWAEGAAVVIENATGNIVALVGGQHDVLEDFVRATQARRQPGSTFKIYVYATALSLGGSQTDIVSDSPISLPMGNGTMWTPHNYSGGYMGPLPFRRALALSRNLPSVHLALKYGPQNIAATAHRMGVTSPLREDLTLALGSSEVAPIEQAMGMATVARMGMRPDPVYLLEVHDMEGRLLGRAGEDAKLSDGRTVRLPGGPGERALDPGVAYELADMLEAVVQEGTGRRAWRPDHVRIGKTGTSNDATDTWFVGATADYTAAVWVGTDRPESLGHGETGGRTALPAWVRIIETLPPPSRPDFPMPPEAAMVPWDGGPWLGVARSHVPDRLLRRPAVTAAPLPRFPAPRPATDRVQVAATASQPVPTPAAPEEP